MTSDTATPARAPDRRPVGAARDRPRADHADARPRHVGLDGRSPDRDVEPRDQGHRLAGHQVTGPNDSALLALADELTTDGGTDLSGGLQKGYDLATQFFGADRINRLAIMSDGMANVGVNDTLMDVVTDDGNGAYVYLDTFDEADKMLGGRFDEVMGVAARDVQVKPQDLAPGDAMVFNQLLRACDAQHLSDADSIEVAVSWKDPVTFAPQTASTTKTIGELSAASDAQLRRGRAIVAYAEALKDIVPTMAKADRVAKIDATIATVQAANDPGLAEIVTLLETYRTAM